MSISCSARRRNENALRAFWSVGRPAPTRLPPHGIAGRILEKVIFIKIGPGSLKERHRVGMPVGDKLKVAPRNVDGWDGPKAKELPSIELEKNRPEVRRGGFWYLVATPASVF